MLKSKSKILFLISGSIAAFKACQVISRLVQDGAEVRTAMTSSALNFIGPATVEGLTGHAPLTNLWEAGRAMDHIELTRWADLAVLCPATATTLARLTHGLADDSVSALALAWPKEKPFFIFPAMNTQMLHNQATQDNLLTLKSRGFQIATTAAGNLACGEVGEGRLLEPDQILRILNGSVTSKGSILVTLGATREKIDGIRFISNVSTGQTGSALADLFAKKGFDVLALAGEGAIKPNLARTETFGDFNDLNERLHKNLAQKPYTAVIHAAAVSDYSVNQVNGQAIHANSKIGSDQELVVTLKRNSKILSHLKEYSMNKDIRVIGFKLTLNASEVELRQAVTKVFESAVDAVVANDWSQVQEDRRRHPGNLCLKDGTRIAFENLPELATHLMPLIQRGQI